MNFIFKILCVTAISQMNFASPKAHAQPREIVLRGDGNIRDADALDDGVLFKISYEHTIKDGKAVSTRIRQFDLNGTLLVDEFTSYTPNGRLKTYTMTQHQTGESARVETKDQKVFMSFTKDGKISTSNGQLTENTAAPGSLMSYMSGFINQIKAGQKVPVKLAVAERGMVLGFEIAALPEGCPKSDGDLCVNLAGGNIFLRTLVKPIFMSFQKSPEGYRPLVLETPAIVRRQSGKSLKKFTARIDYHRVR